MGGGGGGVQILHECWCCVDRAPVKSVVYDTPYTRANQADINLVVELYRTDLEVITVENKIDIIYQEDTFHFIISEQDNASTNRKDFLKVGPK